MTTRRPVRGHAVADGGDQNAADQPRRAEGEISICVARVGLRMRTFHGTPGTSASSRSRRLRGWTLVAQTPPPHKLTAMGGAIEQVDGCSYFRIVSCAQPIAKSGGGVSIDGIKEFEYP